MQFAKYHALGNDYLVLPMEQAEEATLTPAFVERVCHRNFGLGSDGILYGPLPSEVADFGLRIFNPDGSEAEKSGNGLRIFCRFLLDIKSVEVGREFSIETKGGVVQCQIREDGLIKVEMGQVSFHSSKIPVAGSPREVLDEPITLGGKEYRYYAATIGNPHCVLPRDEISARETKELGPILEKDARFPNRTNVQFLKVIDRENIQIEIWERGAGYTLASGSSSSAAGAVARKMGLVDNHFTVHMPGGTLELLIDDDFRVTMIGPVTRVGDMVLDPELLEY
ncbi:MAG: diaminopimelate epimerase [Verrucomicrobiota bacterium JB022]|nr:diaminopimelate epimerase [Verrucomicrobiota bacterium JB022]